MQLFGWIVKTAFQGSKCISRKFFFLKKIFFVTLGHGVKRFGLSSKKFRQGCQTSFDVSTGILEEYSIFRKKSSFVSIIFDYWVSFFDGLIITACNVSNYQSRKNNFLDKKFFYHFRTMSVIFSGVRKKNFGRVSRRQSTYPKEWLKAKFCLKKRLLLLRFRTLRKWFFALWKKLGKVSQMQPTCTLVQFDENFCLEILVFLSFLDI